MKLRSCDPSDEVPSGKMQMLPLFWRKFSISLVVSFILVIRFRSIKIVSEALTSQLTIGHFEILFLATKATGQVELIIKISTHEMWLLTIK